MKCRDLTPEQALSLAMDKWNMGLEYRIRKKRNEEGRTRESIEEYGATQPLLKSKGGRSLVHSDFRGYLMGGGWTVYGGDKWQGYWRTVTRKPQPEDYENWMEGWNMFGVQYMIEVNEFLCEPTYNFINWFDDNPLEVKK